LEESAWVKGRSKNSHTQTQEFIQPVRERSRQGKGYTHMRLSRYKWKKPGKGNTHAAFIQAARADSKERGNTHTAFIQAPRGNSR